MYQSNELKSNSHYTFSEYYSIGKHTLEYIEGREIAMGGPVCGHIEIDGIRFSDNKFSGPPLISSESIILPILYANRLFGIVAIDLASKSMKDLGVMEWFVLLKEVKEGEVYYCTDIRHVDRFDGSVSGLKHVTL